MACAERKTGSAAVPAVAEKLKLSMASPCDFPAALAISQTSQSAEPAGQFVMDWFVTARIAWLAGAVPSTAAPPTSDARVGKLTFKAGINAVSAVENALVAAGSIK